MRDATLDVSCATLEDIADRFAPDAEVVAMPRTAFDNDTIAAASFPYLSETRLENELNAARGAHSSPLGFGMLANAAAVL